ncbi:hypothetical protein [Paraburkholderia acidiphila]|uniref:Uncharacterized protein n=1 Tax=Paraburkholderia acidiphila TaxID=2571747 RepID=A0A7Z2JA75_9BURK|nr:hypothetical protein [Paraburkholderia acidiphila]QGZ56438.1 hypothetical protein FAZ97_15745 [Paraburkholderia acidiphila]
MEADRLLAYYEFEAGPATNSALTPVFAFFSVLHRDEGRYRRDRMVTMHLLLMASLNVFGYNRQQCGTGEIAARRPWFKTHKCSSISFAGCQSTIWLRPPLSDKW